MAEGPRERSPLGLGDVAAIHDDHTEKPCGEMCPHYIDPRWAVMDVEWEEERSSDLARPARLFGAKPCRSCFRAPAGSSGLCWGCRRGI